MKYLNIRSALCFPYDCYIAPLSSSKCFHCHIGVSVKTQWRPETSSDCHSWSLSHVSVTAIRQTFLSSLRNLTFACKISHFFHSECALERMTEGRDIILWPFLFNCFWISSRWPLCLPPDRSGTGLLFSEVGSWQIISVGKGASALTLPVAEICSSRTNSLSYWTESSCAHSPLQRYQRSVTMMR